jgi:hypothetical protein
MNVVTCFVIYLANIEMERTLSREVNMLIQASFPSLLFLVHLKLPFVRLCTYVNNVGHIFPKNVNGGLFLVLYFLITSQITNGHRFEYIQSLETGGLHHVNEGLHAKCGKE